MSAVDRPAGSLSRGVDRLGVRVLDQSSLECQMTLDVMRTSFELRHVGPLDSEGPATFC